MKKTEIIRAELKTKDFSNEEIANIVSDMIIDSEHKVLECKTLSVRVDATTETTYISVEYKKEIYKPSCAYGYEDCIHDPAETLYDYDNGDSFTVGRYTRDEILAKIKMGCECDDGEWYDDEDK